MKNEIIFMVEESIEGGFEAKALGYSIFTQAETMELLKQMVLDAVNCHFNPEDKPKTIRLHFVKDEVVAV
ncbi:MAG: 2-oxoisovalerate dehydrogenase [Caldisericia bacterium]|nr:2-oxoisovalerate dehydrogenase [Caldisericia bacterium]